MMNPIAELVIDAKPGRLRALAGGQDREPILFLHGGAPGMTPYCSGAHLWSHSLPLFAAERSVLALDLPGSGGSDLADAGYSITAMGQSVLAAIAAEKLGACHLVGSDQGGLIALWLAMEAPQIVRSVTVVSGPTPTATGDGLENLTLAHPPPPPWGRAAQEWALDRLSYARHHIDAALLERCVACAAGAPHRRAAELAAGGANQRAFLGSVAAAKARLYETCREGGVAVPVQLVWTTHDPLTTQSHGLVLYRMLAERQRAAHFHIINRAGAFPFREEPEQFHQIVAAFHDGVAAGDRA
jgi:2-hydroxy-6-oxonona-2,4-dienedioate hydrolase